MFYLALDQKIDIERTRKTTEIWDEKDRRLWSPTATRRQT